MHENNAKTISMSITLQNLKALKSENTCKRFNQNSRFVDDEKQNMFQYSSLHAYIQRQLLLSIILQAI